MRIKVLIVDDSALMRAVLTDIISSAGDLEVVGSAGDPLVARELIKELNPDVITLDVEMPKMNGLEFLERLMRLRPMPVIMISSLTERGSDVTFKALEIGAVDFVTKPKRDAEKGLKPYADEVCEKIRAAHLARVRQPTRFAATPTPSPPALALDTRTQNERLVLIGASTGGTEAIKAVLTAFPAEMPAVLIVQHMPEMFTGSFAKRLDGLCAMHVKEAEEGEKVLPGHVYIAPGHSHLLLRRTGASLHCELQRSEPVNRHRPSVDVLFHSAAKLLAPQVVGAILTGMGKDGAQGLLALRKAGAWTIGQDQDSCVVYGMPREAALIGALEEVAALKDVAPRVLARLRQTSRR